MLVTQARPAASKAAPRFARLDTRLAQHPATHFPLLSNSIVLPLSGTCTGTLTAFLKVSVLVPGSTFPPLVATSFACDGITEAGWTRLLITYAASMGPVVKV